MTNTRLDRMLAADEEIVPSSGFLSSVMERVSEEAAAPPPIPFPWRRAVPGMALAAGAFGWGAYEFVRLGMAAASEMPLAHAHLSAAVARPLEQAGWVALALGMALASWIFARKVAGTSGML